jgi:Cys-tRNA(Pro)/Cys-tRNA(Cys) deacylase
MSTRAILILKKAKVPFDVISYQHDQKGAAFAAQAIGFPLEQTVKTLIANLGDRKYVAALVPGDKQLDLKLLARAFNVKAAGMTDIPTAQRLSGYTVGGISPFGMQQHLETIMERSVLNYASIAINAGKRGLMLHMAPHDIVEVLGCRVAAISR